MNESINQDLELIKKLLFEPQGYSITAVVQEAESQDYNACEFVLADKHVKFRSAKITPTKIGQFVTLWKRIGNGPIMPFDRADHIDLFFVCVKNDQKLGVFLFPKDVLYQKGYISKNSIGGKRAMRVYPPWDCPDNKQAQKTQAWQQGYFVEIFPAIDDFLHLIR